MRVPTDADFDSFHLVLGWMCREADDLWRAVGSEMAKVGWHDDGARSSDEVLRKARLVAKLAVAYRLRAEQRRRDVRPEKPEGVER